MLLKNSSNEAFKKNISTEVHAGKPLRQALAIAYSVKKRINGPRKLSHLLDE